jgi:hypothetical protein
MAFINRDNFQAKRFIDFCIGFLGISALDFGIFLALDQFQVDGTWIFFTILGINAFGTLVFFDVFKTRRFLAWGILFTILLLIGVPAVILLSLWFADCSGIVC